MTPTNHAAELAETSPHKSVGVLRLAAAVGFVLLSTAFTVHAFVVSTEPWQPVEAPRCTGASQEVPLSPHLVGSSFGSSFGLEAIEISLVSPTCLGCPMNVPALKDERSEG